MKSLPASEGLGPLKAGFKLKAQAYLEIRAEQTARLKKEADSDEWQAAIEALMLVARSGTGPTLLARIGVMQALNRRVVREFNPDRKEHHWGKRKLARDR